MNCPNWRVHELPFTEARLGARGSRAVGQPLPASSSRSASSVRCFQSRLSTLDGGQIPDDVKRPEPHSRSRRCRDARRAHNHRPRVSSRAGKSAWPGCARHPVRLRDQRLGARSAACRTMSPGSPAAPPGCARPHDPAGLSRASPMIRSDGLHLPGLTHLIRQRRAYLVRQGEEASLFTKCAWFISPGRCSIYSSRRSRA